MEKKKEKALWDFKVIIDRLSKLKREIFFETSEVDIFNIQVAFNNAFTSLRVDCIKGYV